MKKHRKRGGVKRDEGGRDHFRKKKRPYLLFGKARLNNF